MLYIPIEFEIINDLKREGIRDASIRATLITIAQRYTPILQKRAPVRTGKLRDSLRVELLIDDSGVALTSEVRYAGFVEFGTVKMSPRRYAQDLVPEILKWGNQLFWDLYGWVGGVAEPGTFIREGANQATLTQPNPVARVSEDLLDQVKGQIKNQKVQPAIVAPVSIGNQAITRPLPPVPDQLGEIEGEIQAATRRFLDADVEIDSPEMISYVDEQTLRRLEHRNLMNKWVDQVIAESPVSDREAAYWFSQIERRVIWNDAPVEQQNNVRTAAMKYIKFIGRSDIEVPAIKLNPTVSRAQNFLQGISIGDQAFVTDHGYMRFVQESIWHELGHSVEGQLAGIAEVNYDFMLNRAVKVKGKPKLGDIGEDLDSVGMRGEKYMIMPDGKELPGIYWSKVYNDRDTEMLTSWNEAVLEDGSSRIKIEDPELFDHFVKVMNKIRTAPKKKYRVISATQIDLEL